MDEQGQWEERHEGLSIFYQGGSPGNLLCLSVIKFYVLGNHINIMKKNCKMDLSLITNETF